MPPHWLRAAASSVNVSHIYPVHVSKWLVRLGKAAGKEMQMVAVGSSRLIPSDLNLRGCAGRGQRPLLPS